MARIIAVSGNPLKDAKALPHTKSAMKGGAQMLVDNLFAPKILNISSTNVWV